MPNTDSITIIKRFTFRGKDEEWSNSYHLEGTTPTNEAGWKTLADAVIASEKTVYSADHRVVRAYGYVAGNEHAVAVVDYSAAPLTPVPGTLPVTNGFNDQAGDVAMWLRARTPDRNSRGKWIYLRKYFHGVRADGGGVVMPSQRAAALAHGNLMKGGTLPGSMKWCGPQGADALVCDTSLYATTRTLKRRGKRPSS